MLGVVAWSGLMAQHKHIKIPIRARIKAEITDSQKIVNFYRMGDTVFIQITGDTLRYFTLPDDEDNQKFDTLFITNDTLRASLDGDGEAAKKLSTTPSNVSDSVGSDPVRSRYKIRLSLSHVRLSA